VKSLPFWEVAVEFENVCGRQNNWTESTHEKFRAMRNHLKGLRDYKRKRGLKTFELNFDYFDDEGMLSYEKYKPFDLPDNKALPVVCNQKMNVYLHELCELAGFNEPIRLTYYRCNERIDVVKPKYKLIGMHTGKRTFICNALGMGIPPQVVMKWTGHSDYKAMKPYIDVADEIKMEAMKKFNQFIE